MTLFSTLPFQQYSIVRRLVFFCSIIIAHNLGQLNVRIGHLLPSNPFVINEPQVLKMCAEDLKARGIIPANISFGKTFHHLSVLFNSIDSILFSNRIDTMESCNDYSGVENAAYLHYIRNANIYFGPGCNDEILVIGKLAPKWNVPIIAHTSGDDALADRSIYSTMGSVALTSAPEMAQAILTFIELNAWKQICIVRREKDYKKLSVYSIKHIIDTKQNENIIINADVGLDPYSSVEDILKSTVISTLSSNCRIIVCEVDLDINAATNFMVAARRAQMTNAEYVFILPWLAHKVNHLPWEANNVNKEEVKASFDGAVTITAHGYDTKFVERFQQKLYQRTGIVSATYSSMVYMSLYDALFLYGLALRDALEETGRTDVAWNGKMIWQKMTNRQFIGMTGQVLINSNALRVPNYATYFIKNGTRTIVVELEATLASSCQNKLLTNCTSEHVAHELIQNYWDSEDGQPPPDMPECGYDGHLCDHTILMVVIGFSLLLLVSVLIGYILYQKLRKIFRLERRLNQMIWRVPREDIRFAVARSKSDLSRYTGQSGSFLDSDASRSVVMTTFGTQQVICNGIRLEARTYIQNRHLTFVRKELKLLKAVKLLENDNLNKFYGISFNQPNEFIVLWNYCQRGSLEDILFNEELKLGRNFQISFAKDVVKVMIADKLRHHEIRHAAEGTDDKENDNKDKHKSKKLEPKDDGDISERIQLAPEVIREILATKYIPEGTQAADIYSLGMVIYQILYRVEPFYERQMTKTIILEKIANANEEEAFMRPTFPNDGGYNMQLLSAIEACWLEAPESRPNIKKIKAIYTQNLETQVRERTSLLEEAQQQADRLLYNMLPRSVAEDLKLGKTVHPQLYACATVLFSDIPGFAKMSASATPTQVVQFLNDIFAGFDDIIAKHDAYKVETISDAYMIVSGVPKENGNAHIRNIADIALKMNAFMSTFNLSYHNDGTPAIRIGFHSGSVAAGVVGLATPRYCLFGDTVNMASRMESTGLANKIQAC
ncbi:unnamed protein product [Anisakis simplex]|uniref:Guanylate cyclase n=1 Tax=Anisakis simplex TaxID=6269 RepID=A0A158PNJ2_ANISI|nr:unnamed protein product [Anisakis simplex]